jgi:subtilisin family serine protease
MIQRKISITILVLSMSFVLIPRVYGCDPNTTPVVILHIDPCEAIVGQQVICDGSGSYIIEGEITQYDFCFDYQGGWTTYDYTETEANAPDGTFDGKTPHTYNVAGTYTVKLRANGRTDTCTVYVRGVHNITQDEWYSGIQTALNAANDNDVIEVGKGTWNEAIDFNGVNCILRSTDPNDWDVVAETIIDAENLNSCVVTFHSGETNNAVLRGFTLKGGTCGVQCSNSSNPVIERCIVIDNHPNGAAYNMSSYPMVANNQIMGNINGIGVYSLPMMSPAIDNFLVCKNYEAAVDLVSAATDGMVHRFGEGDDWEETPDVGITGAVAEPDYEADEIIVKFKKPVSDVLEQQLAEKVEYKNIKLSASLDSINRKYRVKAIEPVFKNFKANRNRMENLLKKDAKLLSSDERKLLRRLRRAPKGAKAPELDRIYKVKLEAGQSVEQAVAEYSRDSGVEYAELNYIVHVCLTPNDANYPEQWPLNNTGQMYPESGSYRHPPGTAGCDINAPEAWDIHTGSSEIIVAVIDTGVDYNHRDLQGNMWMDANGCHGYDFVNDDNDPMDDHGHGTHCAGVIAARSNNSLDIAGVSWNAKIMPVKFLSASGSGFTDKGAESIIYATDNGSDILSNSWGGSDSNTTRDAIEYAVSQGAIVVAAAGNNNSSSPHYPAGYDGVISVAATDSNDDRASFSNYGSWVDIAAPGVDVVSLRAFATSMGKWYGNKLTIASGTSMACPHVAGACAMVLSVDSRLSSNDANEILRNNADALKNPNICASGRLDVYKAILGTVNSNGYINLDKPYYDCDTNVGILVSDLDLAGSGSCDANLTTSGGDTEAVTLYAVSSGVGIFTGSITTGSGDPCSGDGILQVADGQTITGTYYDADDGTGNSAEPNDTATADCNFPVISNVSFAEGLIGPTQTVTFQTNELTTARIICGTSCGESNIVVERLNPQLSHNIKFEGMEPLTDYYFKIEATDLAGNVTTDSNGGNCYRFVTDEGPRNMNVPGDFDTIQDAISGAWDGSTVWISDGTYTGSGNRDIDFMGRAITVRSINGPENCIIDCNAAPGNAHRGVLFINEEEPSSIIDGLTIKNAYAPRNDYAPWCVEGGAIQCKVGSPTIKNCVLSNNKNYWDYDDPNKYMGSTSLRSGGAGICINYGSPAITNCLFKENDVNCYIYAKSFTDVGGSAIRNNFGNPTITECNFTENSCGTRGAIYSYGGKPTIVDSNFSDNYSERGGGAIYLYYGSAPTIKDCVFTGNSSNIGGAVYPMYASQPDILNCMFVGNKSLVGGGGGFYAGLSVCDVNNCIFIDNDANTWGGGLCNMTGTTTITNCLLFGNDANDGGAIHNHDSAVVTINNCTLAQNTANKGGGIYNHSFNQSSHTVVSASNCILWDNDATTAGDEIYNQMYSVMKVGYSDVEGSGGSDNWDSNLGTDLGGNIDADPNFVNPDANDFHLNPGSPCIDEGDPNGDYDGQKDIDGEVRVFNGRVDIGADEFVINTWYVDADASGGNDGSSWANAYNDLQDALDAASSGDEIWVAQGTYKPSQTIDPNDCRSATFQLINDVGLYGGFSGTETVLSERDWKQNETILSGDIGTGGDSDNCYHVVIGANDAVLDGFTITDGYARLGYKPDPWDVEQVYGGGMYNSNCSPTVRNCYFAYNDAAYGGAMANIGGSPAVTNCIFKGNFADDDDGDGAGGAIYNSQAGTPSIINCLFMENSSRNESTTVMCTNSNSDLALVNCTFARNLLHGEWSTLGFFASAKATITNCIFWDNPYPAVDYIENWNSDVTFSYCDIEGGWKSSYGTNGGGNINTDPLFVDVNANDFHLDVNSPCIDVGDPNGDYSGQKDIDGDDRVIDISGKGDGVNDVDIGADEYDD